MKDSNVYKCGYKITLKSFKEFTSTINKGKLITYYIIGVSLILFGLICTCLDANRPICIIPGMIGILFTFVPVSFMSKSQELLFKRINEDAHGKVIEETYEIDENKINIHNLYTGGKTYFVRDQITRFYESEHLYILRTKYQFLTIEKSSFEKGKCDKFKEFANSMIIKNRKK